MALQVFKTLVAQAVRQIEAAIKGLLLPRAGQTHSSDWLAGWSACTRHRSYASAVVVNKAEVAPKRMRPAVRRNGTQLWLCLSALGINFLGDLFADILFISRKTSVILDSASGTSLPRQQRSEVSAATQSDTRRLPP